MTPEDIAGYSTVADPHFHPDGEQVAFVVSSADVDADGYQSAIWLWNGETARRLTHGHRDARPRWSPDGRSLAFLRRGPLGASGDATLAQLAVMPVDGGEAEIWTEAELGVSEAEWSPDGSRLAVVTTEWHPDWSGDDLDAAERARRPRRITAPHWRHDGKGHVHDKQTWIEVLAGPVPEHASVRVTPPGWTPGGVGWHPDGTALCFIANDGNRQDLDGSTQAWAVDAEPTATDGAARPIRPKPLVAAGSWEAVAHAPDGAVHLVGHQDLGARPSTSRLYRIDGEDVVVLAPDIDTDVMVPPSGLRFSAAGSCAVLLQSRGSQWAIEIGTDGSHHVLAGGRRTVTGVSVAADGTAAFTANDVTDPGELIMGRGGVDRTVTSLNARFRETVQLTAPDHVVVERDGLELDVWIHLPEGDGPFPTLLNIHGGPMAQYGWSFFDEFQVEVGAGYAVVATNPRGGSGRGDEFMKGPVGTWHMDQPPDALDLLAALDGALDAVASLDASRLGIMGGSYGGLITSKILSFDHRFKSAIPERGLYDFTSFAGTSDIGPWFSELHVGPRDLADWTSLWAASPLRTAHLIDTPCLVIHSDEDWRCPIEQGEQLFSALVANGLDAEFLVFPGEGHELSRSGSPRHRVERFEAILEWHGRHL